MYIDIDIDSIYIYICRYIYMIAAASGDAHVTGAASSIIVLSQLENIL